MTDLQPTPATRTRAAVDLTGPAGPADPGDPAGAGRGGVASLRDRPLVRGRLLFSVVPDQRRLRVICSDLAGVVEVRSHHDSPGAGGGLVLVHSAGPLFEGHEPIGCSLIGSCHPWLDRAGYAEQFAALLADDDLGEVVAQMTRLHDHILL